MAETEGDEVNTYSYDAFGVETDPDEEDTNPFRYAGQYYNTETGTYYLRARYYDPATGRFTQQDNWGYADPEDPLSLNLYVYCYGDPINTVDFNGRFWQELWQVFVETLQQAQTYFAIAAGASQIDSIAVGPADIVSLVLIGGGLLFCAGVAINKALLPYIKPISIPKVKEKVEVTYALPGLPTVIYRYGGTSPGNLTPRGKDITTGLSFSTIYKPGAAMTTIEALNATGIVYAVQDGPYHVSVVPVSGTIEDWIKSGSDSIWTQAVRSVVVQV